MDHVLIKRTDPELTALTPSKTQGMVGGVATKPSATLQASRRDAR